MGEKEKETPYVVGAIQRALSVIDFLAAQPRLEAGVSQIADGIGLPRPTVHRLLANLESTGYVSQPHANGSYRLGIRLLELGSLVATELTPAVVARPYLERLRDASGETVHLATLEGTSVVYIEKVESVRAIRMVSRVGARIPAHCTALGKAILAFLPPDEVVRLYEGAMFDKLTDRSIGSFEELQERLATVRRSGYSLDDEEVEIGLRCIGAPIADRTGEVVAAISLSAPVSRLASTRVPQVAQTVIDTAAQISREIGFGGGSIARRA